MPLAPPPCDSLHVFNDADVRTARSLDHQSVAVQPDFAHPDRVILVATYGHDVFAIVVLLASTKIAEYDG